VADPEPADPDAPPTARVVAGSATGQLTGLSGTGQVVHQRLTLDVVLPD